jgi:hypothetical protein
MDEVERAEPALQNLGGHADFSRYKAKLEQLYRSPGIKIIDILGRTVTFPPTSCEHICYGGKKNRWYLEDFWYHNRAELIEWIVLGNYFLLLKPCGEMLSVFQRRNS